MALDPIRGQSSSRPSHQLAGTVDVGSVAQESVVKIVDAVVTLLAVLVFGPVLLFAVGIIILMCQALLWGLPLVIFLLLLPSAAMEARK